MGEAVRSRDSVEDLLAAIRDRYGAVTVNQTTVSVDGDRFETVRDRFAAGPVDAYVAVSDREDRVLHVEGGRDLVLPGAATGADESLENGALAAVEAATGLRCTLEGLREATITGIHNGDDPDEETLYRLVVVFEAEPMDEPDVAEGEWADGIEWGAEGESVEEVGVVAPPNG